MDFFYEETAWAAAAETRPGSGGDVFWEGNVFGGAELAAVVARVATHEDEGRGRGAREAADVPDRVARGMEQVEAAVAEIVEGWEAADHKREVGFWDLAYGAAGEVGVEHRGGGVGWVAWEVFLLETRADD